MPDLSDDARHAMTYWPQIQQAASERMTTADLWAYINEAAEELGLASPGVTLRGVSELRGIAGRIETAGDALNRAPADLSLGSELIADAPWARSLSEQNALGIWQVRFQHTTITSEGPQTDWRTSVFTGQLPATVEELRSAISEDAESLANKYGVSHIDFGNVQVLAI